ncbi:uncharacterized protein LOC110030430 [Phalaenopsis equestris]|uniref:uncharacterized protein LOC110030430 n=1 Tax=Phalaenopsis equestris TaxID=78828 RepID=UPI0009E3BD82|nr:uncharacterized protein LOC110030430 [Phalaenopsis equestris]
MEELECVSFDDDFGEETLDDDVEMADAELVGDGGFGAGEVDSLPRIGGGGGDGGGGCEGTANGGGGEDMRCDSMGGSRRKRNKKKKKRKSGSNTNITDINRFVINTCKRLKEKKSYLVWNAVGCLGASAMMDLVKEVDAIQHCGGQKTADGKRFRTGGGVLWNILKTREPKVYKEIMAKGKEFEKQFRQPQNKQSSGKNVLASPVQNVPHNASESPVSVSSENLPSSHKHETFKPHERQSSVRDRIRVPVCYDDGLLEEGEIFEP